MDTARAALARLLKCPEVEADQIVHDLLAAVRADGGLRALVREIAAEVFAGSSAPDPQVEDDVTRARALGAHLRDCQRAGDPAPRATGAEVTTAGERCAHYGDSIPAPPGAATRDPRPTCGVDEDPTGLHLGDCPRASQPSPLVADEDLAAASFSDENLRILARCGLRAVGLPCEAPDVTPENVSGVRRALVEDDCSDFTEAVRLAARLMLGWRRARTPASAPDSHESAAVAEVCTSQNPVPTRDGRCNRRLGEIPGAPTSGGAPAPVAPKFERQTLPCNRCFEGVYPSIDPECPEHGYGHSNQRK